MVSIEFTPAEIVHIMADCPPTPMIGPRLEAWIKLNTEAETLIAKVRAERQADMQEEDPE